MAVNHPKTRTHEGVLLALLAAALWGLTPVATKGALAGFSPESLGFVRLALSTALFRLLAGKDGRWFAGDIWIWLAGIGLGADFLLYNYGMQRTSANAAGLVVNIELISTIALAVWLLGERFNSRRVLGSAITLAGVLVVTLDGLNLSDLSGRQRTVGNLLVMAAAVSWSLFAVAQRRTTYGRKLFERLTPIFSVATIVSAPVMLRKGVWIISGGLRPIVMFIVLTLFGTCLVYWVYARAQELIDVSVLAILLCSIPVFTLLFAYILLDERVTARLLIGGAVIVAGIVLISTERQEDCSGAL